MSNKLACGKGRFSASSPAPQRYSPKLWTIRNRIFVKSILIRLTVLICMWNSEFAQSNVLILRERPIKPRKPSLAEEREPSGFPAPVGLRCSAKRRLIYGRSLWRRKLVWKLFASIFDSTTRCKDNLGRFRIVSNDPYDCLFGILYGSDCLIRVNS